jgi:beta-lactam-binding protein with PASTA domain
MLEFIKTRYFWMSLVAMGAIVFVLAGLFILNLGWITNHGDAVKVPDLRKMSYAEANRLLLQTGLNVEIADSIYEPDNKPLTVLKQVPAEGMKVKPGRTIYLTVTPSRPPKIKMPDLKDMSLRQAQMILGNMGIKTGQIIYKQDIAKNAILDVQMNGKNLEAGTEINYGATIDLVVGSGAEMDAAPVPDLVGSTLEDARNILRNASLTVGAMVADRSVKRDTAMAIVYKQSPEFFTTRNNTIKPGEAVDLFVTKDTMKVKKYIRIHLEKDKARTEKYEPNGSADNTDNNNTHD